MWFPTVVLIFGVSTKGDLQWATWLGGTWSHLQGVVSAIVYCSKSDIKESVVSLLGCSRLNLVLPASSAFMEPAAAQSIVYTYEDPGTVVQSYTYEDPGSAVRS